MPNPLSEALAMVTDAKTAGVLNYDTTCSVDFPSSSPAGLHVQIAWDGTPSDDVNREDCAVRFTVWAAKGKPSRAQDVAADLRKFALLWGSPSTWRVSRGAGRLPGTDKDNGLPFCTFTLYFVLVAS